MPLPLLPQYDLFSPQPFSFRTIGHVLVTTTKPNLSQTLEYLKVHWNEYNILVEATSDTLSSEDLISLLDTGASQIIVSKPQLDNAFFNDDVHPERLIVRLRENELTGFDNISKLIPSIAGIVIDSTYSISGDPSYLQSLVSILNVDLLPSGGRRNLYVNYEGTSKPTLAEIKSLSLLSILPIIPIPLLTLSSTSSSQLSIPSICLLAANTDRPDGLYPTVVTSESGLALGLVYSSTESFAELLRSGRGVYHSRTRGLWRKGETSGDTQEVVGVEWDCDSDSLRVRVKQAGKGFCHLSTTTCFGPSTGLAALQSMLVARKKHAPEGSYVSRLFNDSSLLRSKIMEEAEELCDASSKEDIIWEAADLIFFALTKCISAGIGLNEIESELDRRAKKISRRRGDAKPKWIANGMADKDKVEEKSNDFRDVSTKPSPSVNVPESREESPQKVSIQVYNSSELSSERRKSLLQRPIQDHTKIMPVVQPIIKAVLERGDAALLEYTAKFDKASLSSPILKAPFAAELMRLDLQTKAAIDQAFQNIKQFHEAQLSEGSAMTVETMEGVRCSRFARPIEKVGLYVPGGSAVLPSTAMMLGVPALVAGVKSILFATPPRPDGSVIPEIVYIAHKVGAKGIVLAGGAQAVAALAYGTESVEKVDKIFGPGNQYLTAAKMAVQADAAALVAVDLPAGPSEVLVVADKTSNSAFVASDLLSQAEHGPDSQVVLVAVDLPAQQLTDIEDEIHRQASLLPRGDVVIKALANSYVLNVPDIQYALDFSNDYAPEHLIIYTADAADVVAKYVKNAGSVFVGPWSPVSCGDYASGTNHTLPTYGYAKMYSGVNTQSFQKHITSQELTSEGLRSIGSTVIRLAEVEGLEAHAMSVRIRLQELGKKM